MLLATIIIIIDVVLLPSTTGQINPVDDVDCVLPRYYRGKGCTDIRECFDRPTSSLLEGLHRNSFQCEAYVIFPNTSYVKRDVTSSLTVEEVLNAPPGCDLFKIGSDPEAFNIACLQARAFFEVTRWYRLPEMSTILSRMNQGDVPLFHHHMKTLAIANGTQFSSRQHPILLTAIPHTADSLERFYHFMASHFEVDVTLKKFLELQDRLVFPQRRYANPAEYSQYQASMVTMYLFMRDILPRYSKKPFFYTRRPGWTQSPVDVSRIWRSGLPSQFDSTSANLYPFYVGCLNSGQFDLFRSLAVPSTELKCECTLALPGNFARVTTSVSCQTPDQWARETNVGYFANSFEYQKGSDPERWRHWFNYETIQLDSICLSQRFVNLKDPQRNDQDNGAENTDWVRHIRSTGTVPPSQTVQEFQIGFRAGSCVCQNVDSSSLPYSAIPQSQTCNGRGTCERLSTGTKRNCECEATYRTPTDDELVQAIDSMAESTSTGSPFSATDRYISNKAKTCSISKCAIFVHDVYPDRIFRHLVLPPVPFDVCGPGRCVVYGDRDTGSCLCPRGTKLPFCT